MRRIQVEDIRATGCPLQTTQENLSGHEHTSEGLLSDPCLEQMSQVQRNLEFSTRPLGDESRVSASGVYNSKNG